MRSTIRVAASCLAGSLVLLAMSGSAAAAPKPISGELSKPGYTVIALAADGKATSARATPRRFKLRPPAKRVTLHLRAKNGTYAGPIVVGRRRHGKRAILGVKAGAKLGKVEVKVRKGFEKLKREPPETFIDTTRKARAKQGVPIGAGNFGRVRSRNIGGGAPGDLDRDGIPDPLDIDDDGDLLLDNFDQSSAARASQTGENTVIAAGLRLDITNTVNANASTLTTADLDGALSSYGTLRFQVLPGDSVELDCGGANQNPPRPEGLVYCSYPGTGTVSTGAPGGEEFPGPPGSTFDPDEDGFGMLDPALDNCQICAPTDFFLKPGARTDQIGTSDILTQRVTAGGAETLFPASLQFVFATVPALVSYSDTAGNCAQVSGTPGSCATEFSYCPFPGCPPGGPGTFDNGFPAASPTPSDDVVLRLTFWRPQRERLDSDPVPGPGQSSEWTDIGNLAYHVSVTNPEPSPDQQTIGAACPQGAFSATEPNLVPHQNPRQSFKDLLVDQPASPANTLSFTLDVDKCLEGSAITWEPGHKLTFFFVAGNGADDAGQAVTFKRQ